MTDKPLTTGFAPVHNGELYYEDAGTGEPVLFIHAGVADSSMWDNQFQLFSKYYRVIRYDTRGFGRSRTGTTEFSNRQDITDLLDHLGVEKAAIIGISRGGQISVDFTIEHPERVSALISVAAGVGGFDFKPGKDEKSLREQDLFSRMEELYEKEAFDELAELEVHAWADGPSQPEGRAPAHIRDYVRRIVTANYSRQDGTPTAQPLDPPSANRLGEIKVPTLVLVGEFDELATIEMSKKLEKDIPNARRVVIPGTAHLLPMEKSEIFNDLVLSFLSEVL